MKTLKNIKDNYKFIFIITTVITLLIMPTKLAHAEDYTPLEGEGWSMSADGVMTIESNRGWWNAMKNGFKVNINKLVIGKEVTEFRIYSLPYDVPSPDFFDKSDIAGYDKYGEPYYEFTWSTDIHSNVIEVETGNPVFQVVDGLLINNTTGELVLSETRVEDVNIPEGVKTITRDAFSERNITSVRFPSTLESIGENAFAGCEKLTAVDFPEGLKLLKDGSFAACSAISLKQFNVLRQFFLYSLFLLFFPLTATTTIPATTSASTPAKTSMIGSNTALSSAAGAIVAVGVLV